MLTRVRNVKTGAAVHFDLPPRAAVMHAHACLTCKDTAWWGYARKYRHLLQVGHGSISMGDWTVLAEIDEPDKDADVFRRALADAIHFGEEAMAILNGSANFLDAWTPTQGESDDANEEIARLTCEIQHEVDRLRKGGASRLGFARRLRDSLTRMPAKLD